MFHSARRTVAIMSNLQVRYSGGTSGQTGVPGEGVGRGGGGGGSIREAGGAFGKMEAVHEDQYFYELQKQQMEDIKKHEHEKHEHEKDGKTEGDKSKS